MHKFVVTASLIVFAAAGANCGGSNSSERAGSVIAPSEVAARGGNGGKGGGSTGGGGGTISLRMVEDLNADGVPSFRDTVTFDVQTDATAYPYVTLKCYQNGTLVSQETNAMFSGSLGRDFTLGPTGAWTGGAAGCTATLEKRDSRGNATVLASASFTTN